MKFTKGFVIASCIMIVLFILPTILSYGAPAWDGSRVYGFPLPFYSWGGLCPSLDGRGQVCTFFSGTFLLIDLVLLVGIPFGVNAIVLWLRQRKSS